MCEREGVREGMCERGGVRERVCERDMCYIQHVREGHLLHRQRRVDLPEGGGPAIVF